MEKEDVKLLDVWRSSYSMRVRLALEAKGVKYELITENLRDKSKLLLDSNPIYKKVPVLLHNGKAIPESLVIVLYVEEAWPEDGTRPSFLPKDPFDRATAHFWAEFIDKKIFDILRSILVDLKGEAKEAALKEIYANFLTLESAFVKHCACPFLNGTDIGYADIAFAPIAVWLATFVELGGVQFPSVEDAPHLHNFIFAIREHPAVKATFPEPEDVLAFMRARLQQSGSA